jgi:hypothetical protein
LFKNAKAPDPPPANILIPPGRDDRGGDQPVFVRGNHGYCKLNSAISVLPETPKSFRIFHPVATVKCDGVPVYRSQVARDAACLFDVDAAVTTWRGMPFNLGADDQPIVPDFLVTNCDGSTTLVDAPDSSAIGGHRCDGSRG